MPLYENVFIARQDISGAQAEALADGFVQLIADQGGEVKKRENWGLRNLAYRMNKNRKGHYVLFNIEAPAGAIAELERTMRINEDVVRYLTLRVDQLDEGPSAIMQNRGSREDRPRRSDRDRYGEGRDGGGERPAAEAPHRGIDPEAARAGAGDQAGALSRPASLHGEVGERRAQTTRVDMRGAGTAAIAIACGSVGACLYLAVTLGTPGGLVLVYITQ